MRFVDAAQMFRSRTFSTALICASVRNAPTTPRQRPDGIPSPHVGALAISFYRAVRYTCTKTADLCPSLVSLMHVRASMEFSLGLFGHTVGSARVEPQGDADIDVLPMVFSVKSLSTNAELHLVASDFHGSTWTSTLSSTDLINMVH